MTRVAARHALPTHRCLSLSNERGGRRRRYDRLRPCPFGRAGNARSGATPNCDCARWAECGAGSADSLRASPRESPSGPLRPRRRSAALASPERRARTSPPYKQPTPTPVIRPWHWSVLLLPQCSGAPWVLKQRVGPLTSWGARSCTAQCTAMTVAIHGMHYTLHAAGCVLS